MRGERDAGEVGRPGAPDDHHRPVLALARIVLVGDPGPDDLTRVRVAVEDRLVLDGDVAEAHVGKAVPGDRGAADAPRQRRRTARSAIARAGTCPAAASAQVALEEVVVRLAAMTDASAVAHEDDGGAASLL